jgi:kinesin family protein C1
MFVMASPLEEHLSETLTSLKFATKVMLHRAPLHRHDANILQVHNTHIGTAKKTTKMRERGDA